MKKIITIVADQELVRLLEDLKKARKMRNQSQIVREALWGYGEKILNQNTTIRVIK